MSQRVHRVRWTKEPYVDYADPARLKSIQFSKFSGQEIQNLAELQVWNNRIYGHDLKPVQNGLLDPRMGPANKAGGNCATCHGDFTNCPGHFGYLKLTLPVFNVGFFNHILNVLKCICKACARILLGEDDRKVYLRKMRNPKADIAAKNNLMKKIRDKCKISVCPWCGSRNGVVKKLGSSLAIVHDFSRSIDSSIEEIRAAISHLKAKSFQVVHTLNPLNVLYLFKKMLGEDCELLNLSERPEKLIVTSIAVPPVTIRPSAFVDAGRSSNEDSITSILKNIINTNSILREDLEGAKPPVSRYLDTWALLQIQVVEYVNSEAPSVPDSKNRGLIQRLKGKQGRFRGNLSGKRVQFTGRTVISPDPNLKITEVAIPVLMAKKLSYPEMVSAHNIEKLRQRIFNGPNKYPGANSILLPDGTAKNLKYVSNKKNAASELQYGMVVERHLEDGDIVLFNRQPSLHRMSIMCHRARIMPWRTLRFNESVCNPYNADFDGDEMNLHVPQTEEARTEALMLMGVQNNLCTPKNGEILVASTQDFLTSSFLMTRKDTFYDRAAFSQLCCYMGDAMESIDLPTPAIIKPIELWTGKQLFSVLVRPNAHTKVFLNLVVTEKIFSKPKEFHPSMCPCDGYVYFRNSELISGQVGKATIGNGSKDGMFAVLLRDYNSHAAASCMNRVAKLSARWIGNHGFSIGINDVQPGEHLNQQKKETIDDGYGKCLDLITKCSQGKLVLQAGCNAAQTLEHNITGELNKIRETAADVCMKSLHWRNSPLIMSQCGSKGSPINISQMILCVGQQSVGGRRAPNGFIDRTLPHFPINSNTPSAKGFVANSFYTGLTPTEFFFHTMGGREGLVDTAVKTAETGYMSRRLMKGLEDLSVYYDQTVRSANGGVVQFLYGDDGMDPAKMEGKNGIPLNLDQLFMKIRATCPRRRHDTLSPSEALKILEDKLEKSNSYEGGCSDAFKRLLSEFVHNQLDALEKTRNRLHLNENQIGRKDSDALENVAANISGITSRQLEVFLETCISRYHSKKVEAGASMGAIGAHSIGEPGTQMTLKTFHFAGVASMNVTLGVPRIKEIINAAKKISTPIITAELNCKDDLKVAELVRGSIEKIVLGEVSKTIKTVFKSSRPYIAVKLDMDLIKELHIGISAESVSHSIVNHPKIKLKHEHVHSMGNKLKIYPPDAERNKLQFQLHSLKNMLPKVIVKGIPTAERVVIHKEQKKKDYRLLVEGTNLLAVMGTQGIDGLKTTSNNVMEVQQTLGIEAARTTIISEIQTTMKNHGMSIDVRHMMLLADLMTYKGEVLGITRYGIAKMKESVLMLASFEKTAEHLFNGSYAGKNDKIEGVSECIIMGIPMQLGTGILKVRQRVDKLPELKYAPDPILG